jgi:hypothetical protein
MVYNTQNYCVLGLYPTSDILETRRHKVSETDRLSETLFSSFQNTGRWTMSKTPVIHSGHCMYHMFYHLKRRILPTESIYMFYTILNKH